MACAISDGASNYEFANGLMLTDQLEEDKNRSCPTPMKKFEVRIVNDGQTVKHDIIDDSDISRIKLQFLVSRKTEHIVHAIEKIENVKSCLLEGEGPLIINTVGNSKVDFQIILDALANETEDIIVQRTRKKHNTVCLLERKLEHHLEINNAELFSDDNTVFIVAFPEIRRNVKNALERIDKKYTMLSFHPMILQLLHLDLVRDIFNKHLFRHNIKVEWYTKDDKLWFCGTEETSEDILKAVLCEQFMVISFSEADPFTKCQSFKWRLEIHHNNKILLYETIQNFIHVVSTKDIILQILNTEKEFNRQLLADDDEQKTDPNRHQITKRRKLYCLSENLEGRYPKVRDVVRRIEKEIRDLTENDCHVTLTYDNARPQQIGQWIHIEKNIHLVLVHGNIDSLQTDVIIIPRTTETRQEISRCEIMYWEEPTIGTLKDLEKLKVGIRSILAAADKKHRTVTIPLKLSGIITEETFLLYFCDVLYNKPPQYVKTIYLVLEDSTKKFVLTKLLKSCLPTWVFYNFDLEEDMKGYETLTINEICEAPLSRRVNVELVEGDLVGQQVDVIVNSTNTELNLEKGAVSKIILRAAGNAIADECKKEFPKGVDYGEVVKTSGGNINCANIYHFALPKWMPNAQFSLQVLSTSIFRCLVMASKDQHKSIAFPVFGTGILEYPWHSVADTMLTTINYFYKIYIDSTVKVKIVLFKEDKKSIEAFRERQTIKTSVYLVPEDPYAYALERKHKDVRIITLVQSEIFHHQCDALVIVLTQKEVSKYLKDHPSSMMKTYDMEVDQPKNSLFWNIVVRSENTTKSLTKALSTAFEFAVEKRLLSIAIRLLQDDDSPTCKEQYDVVEKIITDKTSRYLQVVKLVILKSNEQKFDHMELHKKRKSETKFRNTSVNVDIDKPKLILTVEANGDDTVFNNLERKLTEELRKL